MAESDTILQLGIEAAREGNREEARNLFGLLTRQEPNNAQAWLWLAGVAEGPEQRRAALERDTRLVRNHLRPMGIPQERALTVFQYLGRDPGLLRRLAEGMKVEFAPEADTAAAPVPGD